LLSKSSCHLQPRNDTDVVYRRGVLTTASQGHLAITQATAPKRSRPEIAPATESPKGPHKPINVRERRCCLCVLNFCLFAPTSVFHIYLPFFLGLDSIKQQNTRLLLAVKVHKARCLKILTQARKSVEEEAERLIQTLNQVCLDDNQLPHGLKDTHSEPHHPSSRSLLTQEQLTPSPTIPGLRGMCTFLFLLLGHAFSNVAWCTM
jgi:hypothetical protein